VRPHPSGKGVLIEATNEHAFAIAYDPSGTANRPYICGEPPTNTQRTNIQKLVTKAGQKKYRGARVVFNESHGYLINDETKKTFFEIEAPSNDLEFIDIDEFCQSIQEDRAVKSDDPETLGQSVSLRLDLIDHFKRANKILGNRDKEVAIHLPLHATGPVIITIPNHRFFGAIMPLEIEPEECKGLLPDWLPTPPGPL